MGLDRCCAHHLGASRRVAVQWSAGAAFLLGAAVELLLLDFGSLGELANILAVIAAGGVFLLVGGWRRCRRRPRSHRRGIGGSGFRRSSVGDPLAPSAGRSERDPIRPAGSHGRWHRRHGADHGVALPARYATERINASSAVERQVGSDVRSADGAAARGRSGRECGGGATRGVATETGGDECKLVARLHPSTRCTW